MRMPNAKVHGPLRDVQDRSSSVRIGLSGERRLSDVEKRRHLVVNVATDRHNAGRRENNAARLVMAV